MELWQATMYHQLLHHQRTTLHVRTLYPQSTSHIKFGGHQVQLLLDSSILTPTQTSSNDANDIRKGVTTNDKILLQKLHKDCKEHTSHITQLSYMMGASIQE